MRIDNLLADADVTSFDVGSAVGPTSNVSESGPMTEPHRIHRGTNGRLRRSRFRRRHNISDRLRSEGPRGRIDDIRSAAALELEEVLKNLPKAPRRIGNLQLGSQSRRTLFLEAPETLSLSSDEHRNALLSLVYEYQWLHYRRGARDRDAPKTLAMDLAPVRTLSLDAALVVTAEYHRLLVLHKNKSPVIDDLHWDSAVRELFDELGLLKLVSAAHRTGRAAPTGNGRLKFVPFVSGEKVEQREARQLIERLRLVAGQAPEREAVYAALVEAIGNVKSHAYPDDVERAVPSIKRWWAAGAYDPDEETLQFAVYDQGVGIPKTLPRRRFWQAVTRLSAPERTDADVITGAIRYGRTRFRASQSSQRSQTQDESASRRGNGLWAICQFIPQLPGSSVRIVSGRGEVTFTGHRRPDATLHDTPFCGTLIQWNLKLPATIASAGR